MLRSCIVLHAALAAAIVLLPAARGDDVAAWKAGDRGFTLQGAPLMSGKTRLGTVPAGIELTAEKVQHKWILIKTPVSGEKETREGWVASEFVGHLPSDLPSVFPEDFQGKWTIKGGAGNAGKETLIVRESYLSWIPRTDTVHLVRSTALTGVTQSGFAGSAWKFHGAQFVVPYAIGMPLPPREGAKPVVVQREADVSKEGEEIVLTLDAAETTVQGIAPAIPRGVTIEVVKYVTNGQGKREGVYRLSVPKEEIRFRRHRTEPR